MTQQEKDIRVLIEYAKIQANIARRCAAESLNASRIVNGHALGYTEDFFFDIESALVASATELESLLKADIDGQ